MTAINQEFWIYKLLIDPLTSGLRNAVHKLIEPGSTVLDIACGTGSLLVELSLEIKSGIGVDLNATKIEQANRIVQKKNIGNVEFLVADATQLKSIFDKRFDYVILSLAIHQFPEPLRSEIIQQAIATGKHLILADYSVPVPVNFSGLLSKSIERIAGAEHFDAYKSFVKTNGLEGICEKHKLKCIAECRVGSGVFTVLKVNERL